VTVTRDEVRDKLRASSVSVPDNDIDKALAVARELVDEYTKAATVPPKVIDRAVFLVTVEQLTQDKAPNGVLNQSFVTDDGDSGSTPVRISRDPLKPAYPVLDRWVGGKFFCA
jgi:hypothetical protein